MSTATYLLTGDVGGTNSRMGLYKIGSREPLAVMYYRNEEHISKATDGVFECKIIAPFLKHCWKTVNEMLPINESEIIACLACAGPVQKNTVKMSNLKGIYVDGSAIEQNLYTRGDIYVEKIRVCRIINDFVAQGYGCLTLQSHEVKDLVPNSHKMVDPRGPKVCVGAGTGLGQCFLTPDGNEYACFPSEGGHVEYNPRSDLEIKLRAYLMNRFGEKHRISAERVVSGRGLANVYEFLVQEFPDRVDAKVHNEFLDAGDMQGKVVSDHATPNSLCRQALEIMVAAYGSEVGSSTVKFIPTGGMYVTGGLTPKNIKHIQDKDSEFMKAYFDKGRVKVVLDTVPLFAVMVEDLGVRGALKCAVIEYEKLHKTKDEAGESAPALPKGRKESTSRNNETVILVVTAIAAAAVGILLGRRSS